MTGKSDNFLNFSYAFDAEQFKKYLEETLKRILMSQTSPLISTNMSDDQITTLVQTITEKVSMDKMRSQRKVRFNANNLADSTDSEVKPTSTQSIQTALTIPCNFIKIVNIL